MEAVAVAEAWPYKLLKREQHGRLVDDLVRIAAQAGVPASALDRSMVDSGCSPEETEWVVHYHAHLAGDEPGGLILQGNFKPAPVLRMHAMAAAFLRNYMDARVVSLATLTADDAEDVNPRVMLVPDFFQDSTTGGAALPHYKFARLHGLLLERFSARRGSILHIDSMAGLRAAYGKSFSDFLLENWKIISST